jgi:hypothetical protein
MKTKLITIPFRIQRIFWSGGLVATFVLAGQTGRATTIFDNTPGIFNGVVDVSTTRWLAGRF